MENVVRYDAAVVGAGSAGLSAALVLGRSRRRVLVLDGGEPRNAPSSGVHYFLTRDGTPPAELLRIGREQLEPYSGVEVRQAGATEATGVDGDFLVTLEDGSTVGTRKILLATGVHDELPERPGFREFWGRGITTEALIAVTDYAFRRFDLCRLYAHVFEGNDASARVLEKAGYMFEGRMRKSVTKEGETFDQLMYAMVRA